MPKLIKMPKLSDTMTEGTLVKWLVREGEPVDIGRAVADVETDKATMEMQTFDAGVVHKLLLPEGSKVPLGAGLAVLLDEGETAPADLDGFVRANEERTAAPAPAAAGPPSGRPGAGSGKRGSASALLPTAPAPRPRAGAAGGVRVKASPLARKIAAQRGLDLSRLVGTGPGGRIVRSDVESAPGSAVAGAGPRPTAAIRPVAGPGDRRIPLTGMRTIIADRLLASKTQIPHFYLQTEMDAAPLMAFRAYLNEESGRTDGNKYTVNDFFLKAAVLAAVAVPAVNAAFDGDAIVQFQNVNLSVAIALPEGLLTPVIRAAETKTLLELSRIVKDLATRAKNKKLGPDEFAGGTLTVTNLGAHGIDQFAAIINPPQAAIISVGGVRSAAVVDDKGRIVAGQRVWVGLSGDHRVVDGSVGAQFLAEMRKLIENPTLMLV